MIDAIVDDFRRHPGFTLALAAYFTFKVVAWWLAMRAIKED